MDNRNLGAGLMVLASSLMLLVGTASAQGTARAAAAPAKGTCVVKSLPSFVLQGEFTTHATVADVIEVGCDPFTYGTGSRVAVTASQLVSRCGGEVDWYIPNPYRVVEDSSRVELTLDADGNATVALTAGTACQAGENLISVHQLEEPFETFTTSFSVLPPIDTPEGVTALPSSQVEDSASSAVATIIETEVPGASEKFYRVGSEEMFARCRSFPHVHWILPSGEEREDVSEVTGLRLDNNGNGFVVLIGDSSCYPGASLIESDLESKPFKTLTTEFTILSPRPRLGL
jgi:hypothetical protein